MSPKGSAFLLATLFLIAPLSSLRAQCSPSWNVFSQTTTPDYVYMTADPQLSGALSSAMSMWQGCAMGTGMRPQLPYPTTSYPYNAATGTLNVRYHTGFNPTQNTACAQFPGHSSGTEIDVYEKAYTPSGTEVQCSSFGYDFIIAHEMGHYYHLTDTGAGCTDIMGQANGLTHTLTTDDCTQAKNVNHTLSEDYPVDYSCREPCYGNCVMGQCPAMHGGSPIVLNLDGNVIELTGPGDPVFFDIYNNGTAIWTSWTDAAHSNTVLLCDDLNGNGTIDNAGELFGNNTRLLTTGLLAANGYQVLAEYDDPQFGGNGDRQLSADDLLYSRLRVWRDTNHDGQATAAELQTLSDAGVLSLFVDYQTDRKQDRHGNQFVYRSKALVSHGSAQRVVKTYDVTFVPAPAP